MWNHKWLAKCLFANHSAPGTSAFMSSNKLSSVRVASIVVAPFLLDDPTIIRCLERHYRTALIRTLAYGRLASIEAGVLFLLFHQQPFPICQVA